MGPCKGLNKAQTAAKYGDEQVLIWRRSYDIPPPALERADPRYPGGDPRYRQIDSADLPVTECLQGHRRAVPAVLAPGNCAGRFRSGRKVIIAAHGNSLRALVKHLDDISDQDIVGLNIPTGVPLVYELDDQQKPIRHYYLGDPEEVARAAAAVANQGKAR